MSEPDLEQSRRELLATKQRRLHALQQQAALHGIDTRPEVTIEIEDITREIASLQAELDALGTDAGAQMQFEARVRRLEGLLNNLARQIKEGGPPRIGQQEQFSLYRTNVAQAFWYLPSHADEEQPFAPARMAKPNAQRNGRPVGFAWFDELLRDGLYLPNTGSGGRPLTMVIAGPPGSGKTTLALEICYRLAKDETRKNPRQLCSLYLSLDQDTNRLITNAERLGYDDVRRYLFSYDAESSSRDRQTIGHVAVYGRDSILQQNSRAEEHPETGGLLQQVVFGAKRDLEARMQATHPSGFLPDLVVVDSLNILLGAEKVDLFHDFQTITSSGSKLVVFVIDSLSGGHSYATWEYACDFVVRLDYTTLNNYYIRTIEVVKARYQSHVWGKHQLKVYEKPQLPPDDVRNRDGKLRRMHPYRTEGGVFIYPSIHYYLSLYKRQAVNADVTYATTKPSLRGVLESGIPEGRCTAFIGTRGGHKSHLGYLHLLHRVIENGRREAALIISLRDDEDMTASTLDNIIRTEFRGGVTREELERENRLEILYFHPGYITPEEFFNRLFISVKRLVKDGNKLTVLFNSVDQLASRFPLCAKENIFIPGIIEFLTGEGATSIFIAVDEQGQPAEQYGLLPMADLILSFYPHRIKYADYETMLLEAYHADQNGPEAAKAIERMTERFGPDGMVESIVLQVVRFAGGEQAGARGILELVKEGDTGLYGLAGLHFTPIPPKIQPEPMMLSGRRSLLGI